MNCNMEMRYRIGRLQTRKSFVCTHEGEGQQRRVSWVGTSAARMGVSALRSSS